MFRVLSLFVAGVLLAATGASADADDDRIRVAILPMVVHAQEDQDYLRAGVADMLTARIGQSPEIAVIRVREPEKATTDPDVARLAGQELNAEFVIYGSLTSFGQGASLDARCLTVGGSGPAAERSVFIQAGTLGEIIPRIDELAVKVVNYVVESEFGVPDVAAAPATALAPVGAPPVAGEGADAPGSLRLEVESLRQRVEKLETMIYGNQGELGDAAP